NPPFRGALGFDRLELDYFKPLTQRYNLSVDKGLLSAKGQVEFGSKVRRMELEDATIDGVKVEYVHAAATAAVEQTRVTQVVETAKAAGNAPDLLVKIARLRIRKSTFGYVNKSTKPVYRVFVADTDVTVNNLSNQTSQGIGTASLKGKFMDSGNVVIEARSRAQSYGPAFDVSVQLPDVDKGSVDDRFRS